MVHSNCFFFKAVIMESEEEITFLLSIEMQFLSARVALFIAETADAGSTEDGGLTHIGELAKKVFCHRSRARVKAS